MNEMLEKLFDKLPYVGAIIFLVIVFLKHMKQRDKDNADTQKDMAVTFKDTLEATNSGFQNKADECRAMGERSLDSMDNNTKTQTELVTILKEMQRNQ